jgi:MATE family multidrug resistance protein
MYVAVFANLLNIVLDYLLIFGKFGFPQWGIAGAAAATVISIGVQGLVLHALFMSKPVDREYASRSSIRFDLRKTWDLVRIGFPAGMSNFTDVLNWAIFTSFIIGGLGTLELAAQTAAINFMHFSFIPIMGFMFATQAIVGQWIGRGDIAAAKTRAYTAMKISCSYMVVMGTILAVFGGPLIELCFSKDPAIIGVGSKLLILAAIFAGFDGVGIISMGALRGAGDTTWMMVVNILGTYLFSLPVAYALAYWTEMGAVGAWIGATIYIILIAGMLFWRFKGEKWRDIKIFSEEADTDPFVPSA